MTSKIRNNNLNIIIFYEHVGRELLFVKRILKKFEEKEINARAYSYLFEYYESLNESHDHPPTHLIVPYIYSKNSFSRYRHFLERYPNIQVINMHHEQIVATFNLSKAIPIYPPALSEVFHISWGKNYTKMLLNAGAFSHNIIEICSPRLVRKLNIEGQKELRGSLAAEFELDVKKEWILFCEDRDWTIKDKLKVFTTMEKLGIQRHVIDQFYNERSSSLSIFCDKINSLGDDFFSKYEFIYRSHPGVNGSLAFNNDVRVISKYSVYDWFQCVKLNVVDGSSSCFESDSLGVMTAIYQVNDVNKDFQVFGLSDYHRLDSMLDLLNDYTITTLKNQRNKNIYKSYIGDVETDFYEVFANYIMSKQEPINIKKNLYKKRVYFLKKWLFEKIVCNLPKRYFSLITRYLGYGWIGNDRPL